MAELTNQKAQVKRIGFAPPAVIALPQLGIALYLLLDQNGLWHLGQIQLGQVSYAGPVPHMAFAAIISAGMSWYALARPAAVLAGATVLVVLLSLIAVGESVVMQQLVEALPRALVSLALWPVSLTAGIFNSVSVMLVVRVLAPGLRKRSYWLTALILWPVAGIATFLVATLLAQGWALNRSSMAHLYFGTHIFSQCIIFMFIGRWLDQDRRRRRAISRAF